MSRSPLPPEVTRCHNIWCIRHHHCARWIDRARGHDHTQTLSEEEGCDHFIGVDTQTKED